MLVSPSRHNLLIDLTGQDDVSLCGIYKENKFQAGEATSKTLFLFYILVLKESRKTSCLFVCLFMINSKTTEPIFMQFLPISRIIHAGDLYKSTICQGFG